MHATLFDLPPNELKRRIAAARTLRGVTQEELERMFERDGLDKKAAGRLERGSLTLTRSLLDGLTRNLRVPERWFTVEDLDEVVGFLASESERAAIDEIRADLHDLTELERDLDQMVKERGPLLEEIRGDLSTLLEHQRQAAEELAGLSAEDAVATMQRLVRAVQELQGRLGRDVGFRDLDTRSPLARLVEDHQQTHRQDAV